MQLAHSMQRRQDINQEISIKHSPSSSNSPYLDPVFFSESGLDLDQTAYTSSLPPALDLSYCDSASDDYYVNSRQSTPYDQSFNSFSDPQYMTNPLTQNARLRVQQSTSLNAPSSTHTPPPMSEGSYNPPQPSWTNFQDQLYLSPQSQQQYSQPNIRTHKRLSSGSSVASAGPDSPYTASSVYPHIVDLDAQSAQSPHQESFDGSYLQAAQFAKPLFAPSNAHTGPLVNPAFQRIDPSGNNAVSMMAADAAMRQAMVGQGGSNTSGGQEQRRSFRGGYDGSSNTPKFDRTMSDVYNDELFNPNLATTAPQSQVSQQNSQASLLSPGYRSVFNERLRAANTARSASPVANASRERSPFRPDSSEYGAQAFSQSNPNTPASRLNSAAQIREQQKIESDAQAYYQHQPQEVETPKTISPKEFLPDYESDTDGPMTSMSQAQQEPIAFTSANPGQAHYSRGNPDESTTDQNFSSMATSRRQSSNLPSPQQNTTNYTFMPPNVGAPPQYPFISQSRRQSSSMRSNDAAVPDFPASLTSMESTKSDTAGDNIRPAGFSSQESASSPPRRPSHTTANAGTYTCTAQNCNSRFDTSARLQKHRREAHRASPRPSTPATPSTPTSAQNLQAAQNNASRNNAPGPHKCERVNPSTGKPCNTVFSRSYDLTRHEDTIHNNRKQKVRCHMCVEKFFSRNDALTRHMRVVHPDVDFPGKVRRGRAGV